jgi:hypothetical protein
MTAPPCGKPFSHPDADYVICCVKPRGHTGRCKGYIGDVVYKKPKKQKDDVEANDG